MNCDLIRATWRREPLVIPGVAQKPFHEEAIHEDAARVTCDACSKKPNDSGFLRPWMKPVGSLQVQGAPLLSWE